MTSADRGRRFRVRVVGLGCLWFVAPALVAQSPARNHLYDRLQVTGGPALVLMDTRIRVDAPAFGSGTEISLEDDLGLSGNNLFGRAAIRWRPFRRQAVQLGYQRIRRSARDTLERDITWGDTTFMVGAAVRGWLDSDALALTWRWAILANDDWLVGPSIGVGALFFDTGIAGDIEASGGASASGEESVQQIGPTAALGAFAQHRPAARWVLEADARALWLTIDEYSGRILEGEIAARYYATTWLGIEMGAEANGIRVNIDLDPDEEDPAMAYVRYAYLALRLTAVVAF